MNDIAVVVCLHGDEPCGLKVGELLKNKMEVFIANPLATDRGVRYIDSDLNRVFPGNEHGNYEEKIAFDLLKKLKKFDYVIDVHSSSCQIELFGIITKPNRKKIQIAEKMGLKRVVIMPFEFAKGRALIDHLENAVSLEVGPHLRNENGFEIADVITKLLENKNEVGQNKIEILEVFDMISGDSGNSNCLITNFEEVKSGQIILSGKNKMYATYDFIPVLVGERAYNGIICLATRKINFNDLV